MNLSNKNLHLKPATFPVIALCLIINGYLAYSDNALHPFFFIIFFFVAALFKAGFGNTLEDFYDYYAKGYLIDLIAAIIMVSYWQNIRGAYYTVYDGGYSDVFAYMDWSKVAFNEYFKSPYFNDPGFYVINRLIAIVENRFSHCSYLLHLHILFAAGGLLRCYLVMILKEVIINDKHINILKILILFYPKIIVYSSGVLYRDVIIALFVSVFAFNYCLLLKNKTTWVSTIIKTTIVLYLSYFFRQNMPILMIITVISERSIASIFYQRKVLFRIAIIISLVLLYIFSAPKLQKLNLDFKESVNTYNAAIIEQQHTSSSLGSIFMSYKGFFGKLIKIGYNTIIPLPFYNRWYFFNYLNFCSILLGLGALIWQLMIGVWFAGFIDTAIQKKPEQIFLAVGAISYIIIIGVTIPSNRYTFPAESFMWGPMATGLASKSMLKSMSIIIFLLMYSIYFILKY